MNCPRCHQPLVADDYPTGARVMGQTSVPIHRCDACNGLLVALRHNAPFVDALAEDLAPHVRPGDRLDPHPGHAAVAGCPRCGVAMERFGYLESAVVTLDRCRACAVIWHDGDELTTTAALCARNRRATGPSTLDAMIGHDNRVLRTLLAAKGWI